MAPSLFKSSNNTLRVHWFVLWVRDFIETEFLLLNDKWFKIACITLKVFCVSVNHFLGGLFRRIKQDLQFLLGTAENREVVHIGSRSDYTPFKCKLKYL